MSLQVAAGSNLTVKNIPPAPGSPAGADKRSIEFGRLLMEDLSSLQADVPGDSRFVTIFELTKYAETHTGCDRVLFLARKRMDPAIDDGWPKKEIGSILLRVQLARYVMSESLIHGEEGLLEKEADPKNPAA